MHSSGTHWERSCRGVNAGVDGEHPRTRGNAIPSRQAGQQSCDCIVRTTRISREEARSLRRAALHANSVEVEIDFQGNRYRDWVTIFHAGFKAVFLGRLDGLLVQPHAEA